VPTSHERKPGEGSETPAAAGGEVVGYIERLGELASESPDHVAYVHLAMDGSEQAVTWRQLDERSSQVAAAYQHRGVGFGDLVGLGIRNSPELVFAVLAAWKLGAVPVPVRWDVPDWELERLKQAIAPKLYLSAADLSWLAATAGDPVPRFPLVISPNASGICSSGSTGTPKVILSQAPAVFNPILSRPIAVEFGIDVSRPQRVLVLAPMYHVNAFATIFSLVSGDQLFVLEKFDAARTLAAIEQHGITTFTATPTMLQRIADHPDADHRDLSSIEWIMQGAAPMPSSLVYRWAGLIGAERIVMAYGGTEGLGLTVINGKEWMEHPGTVGRPFRGAAIRILDDDMQEVPPGQIGHIFMKPPEGTVGAKYLGEVPQIPWTPDGYGSYGDMGHVDEDGYLYLADRRVDLIVTGGANVFPAEVEAAIIDHPKVADVVVVGLKDPEWGRRVHAVIQPVDPGAPPSFEEIKVYVRGRLLPYKAPKSIEFVDAIPRSEAMKVNRGRLVEERGG
jgi:bile acid-coenzyme A ligase